MALELSTHHFSSFQPSSPGQSSTSYSNPLNPRSSFYVTGSRSTPNSSARPSSFSSIDSGYASTVGPQSDSDPMRKARGNFGKKHLASPDVDICRPNTPTNGAGESQKPRRVLFLQRRKKSPDDMPSEQSPRSSWYITSTLQDETSLPITEDGDVDDMQKVHSPATAFEAKHHFTTRRGMIHHPYPPDQVPYMQAYDRTLLDK